MQELNTFLESDLHCPDHMVDTLNQLRHNAEDDLSNILHLKSIYPSQRRQRQVKSEVQLSSRRPVTINDRGLGDEEADEVVLDDDDVFAIDGVAAVTAHHSDDEEERVDHDIDADEGIHIPGKFRPTNKPSDIAASLPVGIPWPALAPPRAQSSRDDVEDNVEEKDIAASIQALAKSVHTSSIFGDNVFGDLPRPRTNTYSKD